MVIQEAAGTTKNGSPPLTVVFVSPGWHSKRVANGVATYVETIVPALRELGCRAHVVTDWAEPGSEVHALRHDDADTGPITRVLDAVAKRLDPERAVHRMHSRAVRRTILWLRQPEPSGRFLFEMEEAFGWGGLMGRLPAPLVLRLHGPWFLIGPLQGADPSEARFAKRVHDEGRALARAAGVTAPSLDVLRRTREHYGLALDHAAVIPNPVSPVRPSEKWRPDGCDKRLVLFVGRFDGTKGGDSAIDAFARIAAVHPESRFAFVGKDNGVVRDGRRWSLPEYFESRLPGALASGRVTCTGQLPRDEVSEWRRRAAVVMVPSRYETFSLTIGEAMALGCPVVASRTGGAGELFTDGVHGLYVPPDDPAQLANAVSSLLGNPERAAAIGAAAAAYCEQHYAPDKVATRMAAYYRSVLERAAHGKSARAAT
jgi:glycosyltransferase involved in cell wall biosynthesis